MKRHVRLGINIDHVATLRNARGENYPEVTEAARIVEKVSLVCCSDFLKVAGNTHLHLLCLRPFFFAT